MRLHLVIPISVCLLFSFAGALRAQDELFEQKLGVFEYDSTFYIGAHTVPDPDLAIDSLLFDFTQLYGQSVSGIRSYLDKVHAGITYDPNTQTWYGDSATQFQNWADSIKKRGFFRIAERGFKTIFIPQTYYDLSTNALALEVYWHGELDHIQNFEFINKPDPLIGSDLMFNNSNLVYSRFVPMSVTPSDTLLGHCPRYTRRVLETSDAKYFPVGYDSSTYFHLSIALRADEPSGGWGSIPDTTVLAYANLYARDTIEQSGPSDCRCGFYKKVGRFSITKEMYLDASNPLEPEFDQAGIDQEGENYFDVKTVLDIGQYIPMPNPDHTNLQSGGWSFGGATCIESDCDSILNERLGLSPTDPRYLPPGSINLQNCGFYESEFLYDFHSTRVVDVAYLRTRISQVTFERLRRGGFMTEIDSAIASVYNDSLINSTLMKIGIDDETAHESYRSFSAISSRIQDIMADSNDMRGIYDNPPSNFDGFRFLTGDFDSVRVNNDPYKKIVHLAVRQSYKFFGLTSPPFYLNPDSMKLETMNDKMNYDVLDQINEIRSSKGVLIGYDTIRYRHILTNSESDYDYYTKILQENILGKFREKDNVKTITETDGAVVGTLARLVDVSRFKYKYRTPYTNPVWNVVQTHSFILGPEGTPYSEYSWQRPPTPEEIAVQAWLSMACGADGIIYGDMLDNGITLGPVRTYTGEHDTEYGNLTLDNWGIANPDLPQNRIDSIWIGRRSRFDMIRDVNLELRRIDTTVGWKHLLFNQKQMSVNDTLQSFNDFPLVDTLVTRRAKRYSFGGGGEFQDSNSVDTIGNDPRSRTYVELTHFLPGPGDTIGTRSGAHYLLIVNRRLWPIDLLDYSTATQDHWDSIAASGSGSSKGLGAIDVRKPGVVLTRILSVPTDTLIIERIGGEVEWRDTVVAGTMAYLEWLKPGRGALYRVRPFTRGVSHLGTAFNNAVHSENPSTDGVEKPRVVVYERDSAVFMRSFDPTGGWSREWMLSDESDTAYVSGARFAHNIYPAVANVRNGESWLAVWERVDTAGGHTVEAVRIDSLPTQNRYAGGLTDTLRYRLSDTLSPVHSTVYLSPSVVGTTDGYVVAWPENDGVRIMALRNEPENVPLGATDTTSLGSLTYRQFYPDTVTRYTTLASVPKLTAFDLNYVYHAPFPPPPMPTPDTVYAVHLGYQQGPVDESMDQNIVHHPVGVEFPSSLTPILHVFLEEWVNEKLFGCNYIHPCIAVDSHRVGMTFEERSSATNSVVLRFRDPLAATAGAAPNPWLTQAYRWGGTNGVPVSSSGAVSAYLRTPVFYERPSLTMFPKVPLGVLSVMSPGVLTWHWTNPPDSSQYAQKLYRFGKLFSDDIPDGKHPTMTLVPYIADNPASETHVFHRGSDVTAFERMRGWGESAEYLPAFLRNIPTEPLQVLADPGPGDGIHGSFEVSKFATGPDCPSPVRKMSGGFFFDSHISHPDTIPPQPPPVPGLPPTFMGPGMPGVVTDLPSTKEVTRTGVFTASGQAVTIRRLLIGSDDLVSWLNTQPFDTLLGRDADIGMIMELLRTSDSTILWLSDTVWARDVGADVDDENVEVPVHMYAPYGQHVFIRLRTFATEGLEYRASAGFHFYEEMPEQGMMKLVRPGLENHKSTEKKVGSLQVSIVPNPATESIEVTVGTTRSGHVQGGIYDPLGALVQRLPGIEAEEGREYKAQVDVRNLSPGIYLVRFENDLDRITERLTIVR